MAIAASVVDKDIDHMRAFPVTLLNNICALEMDVITQVQDFGTN